MIRTARYILSDLRAKAEWCYESRGWKAVLKVLLTDGTPAMILYRLMQTSRRWRLAPFELLFNRCNTIFCSCIIGRGAEFGPEFVLIHSLGVVINGNVRGGEPHQNRTPSDHWGRTPANADHRGRCFFRSRCESDRRANDRKRCSHRGKRRGGEGYSATFDRGWDSAGPSDPTAEIGSKRIARKCRKQSCFKQCFWLNGCTQLKVGRLLVLWKTPLFQTMNNSS